MADLRKNPSKWKMQKEGCKKQTVENCIICYIFYIMHKNLDNILWISIKYNLGVKKTLLLAPVMVLYLIYWFHLNDAVGIDNISFLQFSVYNEDDCIFLYGPDCCQVIRLLHRYETRAAFVMVFFVRCADHADST